MNILWISNILLPDISLYLNQPISFGGGWMFSSLIALKKQDLNNKYAVLCFTNIVKTFIKKEINGTIYYVMPEFSNKNKDKNSEFCKHIIKDFNPSLVHIHGTEQENAYFFLNINSNLKYVVSIQGLLSICSNYYLSHLNTIRLLRYTSLYELVKHCSIFDGQKSYKRKGKTEIKLIQSVTNIIGRTEWDKAHIWAINPNANYYFCNETLRPSFYNKRWEYKNCEPYTIFISQAKNPIKGFHQFLKALLLIIKEYPQTKVYIGSSLNLNPQTLKEKIKMGSYAKYLRYMIKKYNLKDRIICYNGLSETQMCDQFLKCNVFISPSAIENSPNSVGEAQLLGVPTISSYVGGVGDMIEHNKTGFYYRYDEPELLAYYVCKIFAGNYSKSILEQEQIEAQKRHNPDINATQMLNIYSTIYNKNNNDFIHFK